jgi:hypothetical protein
MDARVRKNLTIVACVTPVLAPLAFVIASEAGLVGWALQLVKPVIPASDPEGLFIVGWFGWSQLCAGWVAWQIVRWRPPETRFGRFFVFVSVTSIIWALFVGGFAALMGYNYN